ncbi:MAG: glycosyltransferase [Patulibacter sp.]
MALNEHDPTGPSIVGEIVASATATPATESSEARAERCAGQASEAIDRANDAVAAGDAAAYAAVLEAIDRLDDVHRRHFARLRYVEAALEPRPGLAPASLARVMLRALDALIGWLEENPREPTLLAYAGVLATEFGLYRPAEALFAASLRLDDSVEEHHKSLDAARTRRRANARVLGLPVDVRQALPGRKQPLKRIAAAAKPATGQRISLCMIVRDEEEMLPRCLAAVHGHVDEIVIVDTGSRDRTVEIAESFGATVLHHEWTGDFSEARNIGLNAATGDWFVWLDADEIFAEGQGARLRELAGRTWRECFRMEMVHFLGDADDGEQALHAPLKMFRNRPEYRFRDRIHEQIGYALPGYLLNERFEQVDVRIEHYGYLGHVRRDRSKADRNLTLLRSQLDSGADQPFLHYNLGSEYSAIASNEAQAQALHHFRVAYQLLIAEGNVLRNGYLPSLLHRFVRALRKHQAWGELEQVCEFVHATLPDFTDVYFEQALAAIDRADFDRGRELLMHCLELGDASAQYSPTVGCGTYLAQLRLAQLDAQQGKIDDAVARYAAVRAQHPEYLALVDPYVGVLLTRGDSPDEVLGALTDGHDLSPSGWFMVGANFQERGYLPQAEAAFRGALERRATFDQARVALADALLMQGRIAEALAEVEQVPADVRVGGAALRTAIFSRLALEDAAFDDGLAALVAQLDQSSLPLVAREVLRAWVARRQGTELPWLGQEHVAELKRLMDATLRLGAADAFAELVDVLAATHMRRRQQREVLATLLLVRGLTELAADEWVQAVQEDGPDADAFAGLAEVARLRGFLEDARTLAVEALALEPRHDLAVRVLEAAGG